MSMRSRSPDDNSSLMSASSLDSALNHSREEDEIRALTMEPYLVEEPKEESEFLIMTKYLKHVYFNSIIFIEFQRKNDLLELSSGAPIFSITDTEFKNQRNSNESGKEFHFKNVVINTITFFFVFLGFVSMHSIRGSMLSTRRASEQQQSSLHSTLFSQTTSSHHHQQQSTAFSSTSSNTTSSSSSVVTQQQLSSTRSFDTFKTLNISAGFDGMNVERELMEKVSNNDHGAEDDERPELPVKTRPGLLQKDVFNG